jgi:hypothetical protein
VGCFPSVLTGDGGLRVVEGGAVDGVVSADAQHNVRLIKVVVDLIHLHHHVVGNSGLGKENVELAGHAASYWVDTEADVAAPRPEDLDERGNVVLGLSLSVLGFRFWGFGVLGASRDFAMCSCFSL